MKATPYLAGLFLVACATEQPKPPPPPAAPVTAAPAAEPPDPAPQTDGDVTVGWVHGMQILVKRIPHAELVAGQLYIRGGVRNWGKDDQGAEQLALAVASSGGTQTLDKDAFARKLATLGSSIGAGATNDFSAFSAKSLRDHWDETFGLMVDAFLHPAMPPSEIELQRVRQLSALKHELESPEGQLRLLLHEALFQGHPYANRSIGTLETVKALKPEQLTAHLAKLRETSRLLLVVVGDLDPEHVLAQARQAFGVLPRGNYVETPLPPVRFDKPSVRAVARKLPTNYIEGVFFGPGWHDPDFAAAMVAMQVLSWREWEEVRTKRNLSYAPGAAYSAFTALPRGAIYVTATQPNETMKVMLDEVRKLQSAPVPEKELAGDKATFLTGYLMENEPTDGQAGMLARAQIYGGDWHLARTLPEKIKAVTIEDVTKFASAHIGNLQTVVLGSPEQIDKGLFGSL